MKLESRPFNDPSRRPSLTTVDVPLGSPAVSQLSGRVFMSSDLGAVDTPPGYAIADVLPAPTPQAAPPWAVGSIAWEG